MKAALPLAKTMPKRHVPKSNTGPRVSSQHKDRPIQVRWFPCQRQDGHWNVLSLTWESPYLTRLPPLIETAPGPLIVIHLNGAVIAHMFDVIKLIWHRNKLLATYMLRNSWEFYGSMTGLTKPGNDVINSIWHSSTLLVTQGGNWAQKCK